MTSQAVVKLQPNHEIYYVETSTKRCFKIIYQGLSRVLSEQILITQLGLTKKHDDLNCHYYTVHGDREKQSTVRIMPGGEQQ